MYHYKDKGGTEQFKGEFRHSIKFTFEILYSHFGIPQCMRKCFNGTANLFKNNWKCPLEKYIWIKKGDQNGNIKG